MFLVLKNFEDNFVYFWPEVSHNVILPFFRDSFRVPCSPLFELLCYSVKKLSIIFDFFASFLQLLLKLFLNLNIYAFTS